MIIDSWQDLALPKWPGVFITGNSVTSEQAKEIIFRTDRSVTYPSKYGMGNDHNFNKRILQLFGWQEIFDKHEKIAEWCKLMNIVECEYVYNDWLSTYFIGGSGGWVHPNGTILFENRNYGKWPSIGEILQDWTNLAEAFPYLDLCCTLYDKEFCEEDLNPVCTIVVKDGKVEVHKYDSNFHNGNVAGPDTSMEDFFINLQSVNDFKADISENKSEWPNDWILEFAEKSKSAIRKLNENISSQS